MDIAKERGERHSRSHSMWVQKTLDAYVHGPPLLQPANIFDYMEPPRWGKKRQAAVSAWNDRLYEAVNEANFLLGINDEEAWKRYIEADLAAVRLGADHYTFAEVTLEDDVIQVRIRIPGLEVIPDRTAPKREGLRGRRRGIKDIRADWDEMAAGLTLGTIIRIFDLPLPDSDHWSRCVVEGLHNFDDRATGYVRPVRATELEVPRRALDGINLSGIDAKATLEHLGGSLSVRAVEAGEALPVKRRGRPDDRPKPPPARSAHQAPPRRGGDPAPTTTAPRPGPPGGSPYEGIPGPEADSPAAYAMPPAAPAAYAMPPAARGADEDVVGWVAGRYRLGEPQVEDPPTRYVQPGDIPAAPTTPMPPPYVPEAAATQRYEPPTRETLGVGSVIKGKYEVRELLGEGGFAQVFRVFDNEEHREFALKLMAKSADEDLLRREVEALRAIQHSAVVQVYSMSKTADGRYFIVMEYLQGQLLSTLVRSPPAVSQLAAVLETAAQVLSALVFMHPASDRLDELDRLSKTARYTDRDEHERERLVREGIVHRDIKPANIMLTPGGAKLIDFNISSAVGSEVKTLAGTDPYRMPEPPGARWDASPDLFALGVTLYQVFTGRFPYEGPQPMVGAGPADPSMHRPELPEDLQRFLLKACADTKAKRFPTAQAMLRAVEELQRKASAGWPADATPAAVPEWVNQLVESEVFDAQISALRGRRLEVDKLRSLLAALDNAGGRLPHNEIAAATWTAPHRVRGLVATIGSVLNIDGYAVLQDEGETVRLDSPLARVQFHID